MSKFDAFGTQLLAGTPQIETAVIVGTITGTGNATITTTDAILAGSPLDTVVAVLEDDTPDTVCTKMAAAMNLVAALTTVFTIVADGPNLVLTRVLAAANDATLNIAYTNTTCTGLTPDATSNDTQAGTALTAIAQARSFGGPNLTADTTDVTTHDSTGAFEEMVVTILRTGEVTMGLVYDPANATHDASTGLLYRYENKVRTNFSLIFADTGSTVWAFSGDITAFTPDMAHDSSLDAAATIKISGQPTLV